MGIGKVAFNFTVERGIKFAKNLLHNSHGVVNSIGVETATLESFFAKQGFSKAGTKLVSAKKGLPISELGKVEVPNAATVDIVKVQSGFGTRTTDILSFKDEYGNLIKRNRITKNNDSKFFEKTEGDYWIDKNIKHIYRVDRKTFVGDELIKSENIKGGCYEPIYKTVSEFFDRATKHTYSINYKGKFIKLSALRQTDGLKGNKIFSTLSSNCLTQEELNKLNKLTYLHEFELSGKDFLEAISPAAMKAKKFKISGTQIKPNKLQTDNLGRYKSGKVEIDLEQCITNKQIVKTLNHELQHVKQNEMRTVLILEKICKTLGLEKSFDKYIQKTFGSFSKTKRKFAQKCSSGFKSYTDDNIDYEAYYKNFVEIDARKAGETAEKEYLRQKSIYDDILYNASNRIISL